MKMKRRLRHVREEIMTKSESMKKVRGVQERKQYQMWTGRGGQLPNIPR